MVRAHPCPRSRRGLILAATITAAATVFGAAPAKSPAHAPSYRSSDLPRGADYFELRDGLANAFDAFTRAKAGRVAFLGGSITAMSGWRERVMADLQRRFPETRFDFIGAGIGSLGSVPHAFRLDRDVLARGPVDLLFVEAAVNDASNMPDRHDLMLRGMEGLVRRARLANSRTDIVHLHFVMPEHMTDYLAGRVPEVVRQHERVAAAYGNPSIDLAREVTERIAAGQFTWEGDFRNLHPSPFGHAVYGDSIGRMLDAAFREAGKPRAHAVPDVPLDAGSYFNARMIAPSSARNIRGFRLEPAWRPAGASKGVRAGFVDVPALVAEEPGAEFEFELQGRGAGLFITAGPDAGVLEWSVDGGPFRPFDTFTRWSKNLHLPWVVMLDDGLPAGRHVFRVRIAAGRHAESAGTALRVQHLLLN
jgi:sialidase-1